MCAQIHAQTSGAKKPWSPKLGLFKSIVVTLTYLRRNRVQMELAETYDVSQPTISRVIKNMTPTLQESLETSRMYVWVGESKSIY